MKKNILIRCDASEEIGLGHIVRCLVLAKKLRLRGNKVYFAVKNYTLVINKIRENGFDWIVASKNNFDYDSWVLDIVDKKSINIFIGDIRDGLPITTIKKLKKKGILTVAIDEPSKYAKECDLCFYPPHAQVNEEEYRGKLYKGFEYVILRDQFYKDYERKKNTTANILVMMGGTDPYNLTLEIIQKIINSEQEVNISVIIKKDHPQKEKIQELEKNINIYSDIKNMAEFLISMDFAIISFGVTAYELLAMQVPSIHICLDEEHYISSKVFEKKGFSKTIMKDEIKEIETFILNKNPPILKIYKNQILEKLGIMINI